MKSQYHLLLLFFNSIFNQAFCTSDYSNILQFRGGLVPQADENSDLEYYNQFELDYGSNDKSRIAGSLRGFVSSGKLTGLEESDPFFKWLNSHLEIGPEPLGSRVKPFYAIDFGSKSDLPKGENPQIMIVNRKLKSNKDGTIADAPEDIDIEVRKIWQPWLKSRCDFAIRYIVPNRVNIIKIMESKNRFTSQLQVDEKINDDDAEKTVLVKLTFRPRLIERFFGKRNVVIKREMDANKVFGKQSTVTKKNAWTKKLSKQLKCITNKLGIDITPVEKSISSLLTKK